MCACSANTVQNTSAKHDDDANITHCQTYHSLYAVNTVVAYTTLFPSRSFADFSRTTFTEQRIKDTHFNRSLYRHAEHLMLDVVLFHPIQRHSPLSVQPCPTFITSTTTQPAAELSAVHYID